MSHWGDDSGSTSPSWTSSGATTTDWPNSEASLNAGSAFVGLHPTEDSTGGIDFPLAFLTANPFHFVTDLPKSFRSTAGEIP